MNMETDRGLVSLECIDASGIEYYQDKRADACRGFSCGAPHDAESTNGRQRGGRCKHRWCTNAPAVNLTAMTKSALRVCDGLNVPQQIWNRLLLLVSHTHVCAVWPMLCLLCVRRHVQCATHALWALRTIDVSRFPIIRDFTLCI